MSGKPEKKGPEMQPDAKAAGSEENPVLLYPYVARLVGQAALMMAAHKDPSLHLRTNLAVNASQEYEVPSSTPAAALLHPCAQHALPFARKVSLNPPSRKKPPHPGFPPRPTRYIS